MITTVTLWLLISFGSQSSYSNNGHSGSHSVVERFLTVDECARVQKLISDSKYNATPTRCIQATVVVVK